MVSAQTVLLRGGSYDGQVTLAPPPPSALRYYIQDGDDRWTELYQYAGDETVEHDEHGTIRIMQYMHRDKDLTDWSS